MEPFFSVEKVEGDPPVFVVSGDIDMERAPLLEAEVLRTMPAGEMFSFDMAGVTFIDSTGLGVLLRLRAYVNSGRSIEIRHPSRDVIKLLEITGIAGLFRIVT